MQWFPESNDSEHRGTPGAKGPAEPSCARTVRTDSPHSKGHRAMDLRSEAAADLIGGMGVRVARPRPVAPPPPMETPADVFQQLQPRETVSSWQGGEPVVATVVDETRPERPPANTSSLWTQRGLVACMSASAVAVLLLMLAMALGYWQVSNRLAEETRRRVQAEQASQQTLSLARRNAMRVRREQLETQKALKAKRRAELQAQAANSRRVVAESADRYRVDHDRKTVQREAYAAMVRQLTDESRRLLASHPQRSLFLASEALRARVQNGLEPDPLTEQILRDALVLAGEPGLQGHHGSVQAAVVTPDGQRLITAGCDRTVRIWNIQSHEFNTKPLVLKGHDDVVTALAVSPDGRWLVSAGFDAKVILWDLEAEDITAAPRLLTGHREQVNALAFSADGRYLVSGGGGPGGDDYAARIWDLSADDPAAHPGVLRGHTAPILSVTISPNGRWVATAGEDAVIRLWHLQARWPAAEQIVLRGHEARVSALAVTPDSHWLISGSYDSSVRLWNLESQDPADGSRILAGHEGWVSTVAVSPDGYTLATGSFDKSVRLWDLASDDPARSSHVLEGHTGGIRSLAFSPDGRWLATGSIDRTARLWDLATRDSSPPASTVLRGHDGPVNAIVISPGGRWIATGSGELYGGSDQTVRLWDLQLESLLETARLRTASELSETQRKELLLGAARRSAQQH